MRAFKSYTFSHWVCWAAFQLLGYRWQLDPRSVSCKRSEFRIKKLIFAQTRIALNTFSLERAICIYLHPFQSIWTLKLKQLKHHQVQKCLKSWIYLPLASSTSCPWVSCIDSLLAGLMAPAARPDESKSVQVTKLSNQCGTEIFHKIFQGWSKYEQKKDVFD